MRYELGAKSELFATAGRTVARVGCLAWHDATAAQCEANAGSRAADEHTAQKRAV